MSLIYHCYNLVGFLTVQPPPPPNDKGNYMCLAVTCLHHPTERDTHLADPDSHVEEVGMERYMKPTKHMFDQHHGGHRQKYLVMICSTIEKFHL